LKLSKVSAPARRAFPNLGMLKLLAALLALGHDAIAETGNHSRKADLSAFANTLAPDFLHMQYAGHTGWLSVGAGYSYWQGRFEPGILYGYVPGFISDKPLHTFSQKTVYSPFRLRLTEAATSFPVQAGYSLNFMPGTPYFVLPPSRYPRWNYYWPTGFHLSIFTGTKLQHEFTTLTFPSAAAIVTQVGTSGHYWKSYMYSDRVGLADILSLSLGVQAYF
jgi:hypothetical protein